MTDPSHDRLVVLEEKLAFVERHVGELDDLVRELFDRMAGVRAEITRVKDDVHRQLEEEKRGPEDDVPPQAPPSA